MGVMRVAVLEKNRVAAQRIARVLAASADMAETVIADDALELQERLTGEPTLLACDASEIDVARSWLAKWPDLKVLLWTPGPVPAVLEVIRDEPRLRNVVAWPSFASMPRPWELALVGRRLVDSQASVPKVADLLAWGAFVKKWRPQTSEQRDGIVHEITELLARAGVVARTANRAGEIGHELLMNAMYDAPIDAWGLTKYAQDRKQDVVLDEAEIPTVRFGFDGFLIALEVADPFGRLADEHVIDGILRGAGNAVGPEAPVLDTSHGGAGLGMFQIFASSAALVVDVRPQESTRVVWVFDADLNPRDTRGMPPSLHLFRTGNKTNQGGWS